MKFYKSKPPSSINKRVGVKAKPFFRHHKSGVTRIVRDTYGKTSDWFALCKEVKKRDGYRCIFCKAPEDSKNGVFHDVHHIIPLSRGGTTTKSNLGTTCKTCHRKRHKHMT